MDALLNLNQLLRAAFGAGAVGFTLRTGLHPMVYSVKGVQPYDTQASSSEDIEELLRRLMSSREMRQFRAAGVVHFKCAFENIPLLGAAKAEGDEVRVELRKLST